MHTRVEIPASVGVRLAVLSVEGFRGVRVQGIDQVVWIAGGSVTDREGKSFQGSIRNRTLDVDTDDLLDVRHAHGFGKRLFNGCAVG